MYSIVWPSVLSFNYHDIQKKQLKKFCVEEKVIIRFTLKPRLELTVFQTVFHQVNLTCACNPIENQHLVSSQLKKNRVLYEL